MQRETIALVKRNIRFSDAILQRAQAEQSFVRLALIHAAAGELSVALSYYLSGSLNDSVVFTSVREPSYYEAQFLMALGETPAVSEISVLLKDPTSWLSQLIKLSKSLHSLREAASQPHVSASSSSNIIAVSTSDQHSTDLHWTKADGRELEALLVEFSSFVETHEGLQVEY